MISHQLLAAGRQQDEEQQPPETALRIIALRKEFRFYRHPWDRLVEWASWGRLQRSQVFVALQDINFAVAKGNALGIVGANGAGKSTLLKIICGTLYPTAGRVELAGRVASLLELGTGFHSDFTGRQNIIFNARFLGLSDEEIHERMGAIIEFAELGEFIDRPLRTYSSGMQVRLAFAVMANVDPRILVIDEALSVGDAYFGQKCIARIRRFREEGVTLLFVSHDPSAVKTLCNEALLLHHGQIIDRGHPDDVLESYNTLIARQAGNREILTLEAKRPASREKAPRRSGSFAAVVASVALQDTHGQECRSFIAGEQATIAVRVLFMDEVTDPTVGILIRDRLGNDIYGTNTYHQQITTGHYEAGEELEVTFRLALNLGPGEYSLTVAAHTQDVHLYDCFDWIDRLLVFKILPPITSKFIGVAFLRPQTVCQRVAGQRGHEDWEHVLVQLFGQEFPRALALANGGKPWLFSGWYPPEETRESAFRWTSATFSFFLDLRGDCLYLEAGSDRPGILSDPVRVTVWLFNQPLGALFLDRTKPWSVGVLPIPPSFRIPHALVRMQAEGWYPAEAGTNEDCRILGIRVRRIWVGEEQADR
jgi:lipopolysaccharide transport system ATP-binding protein